MIFYFSICCISTMQLRILYYSNNAFCSVIYSLDIFDVCKATIYRYNISKFLCCSQNIHHMSNHWHCTVKKRIILTFTNLLQSRHFYLHKDNRPFAYFTLSYILKKSKKILVFWVCYIYKILTWFKLKTSYRTVFIVVKSLLSSGLPCLVFKIRFRVM